ncbi:MafI family immunity protein [Phormidium sp. LEGE 05292]|uniref:MafI family immunity protein n=1 Tax=[Phormidium] sp. LEGE 05292 TaxID=767427 RepID=UPI0018815239|nr:MafI family immunity protein [Phormidium sp. LEGE 05292]MBE9228796.1 MafI family immunity protein [Phormidium sp. LEGE 05292]
MFDYKIVEEKLNTALYLVEEILPKEYIDMVRSDIEQGGEWVLALETLCDCLADQNLPISQQIYEILEEIASLLNLENRHRLEMLKPLVSRQ